VRRRVVAPLTRRRQLFRRLPSALGFDVELKFPSETDPNDAHGAANVRYATRDQLVDATLAVVLASRARDLAAGVEPRRLFFSSFDPDVCVMLQLKQPHYAVRRARARSSCDN
jgi:hypothetical protein